MKIFFGILLAILLFVAGTILAAPFFVSSTSVRDMVVAAVKERTGRTLTINGKTDLTLFPMIGIEVNDAILSNPASFSKLPFATLEKMQVRLALLPLLTGKVAISKFVLVKPVLHLAVNAQGQNNWTFSQAGSKPVPVQKDSKTKSDSALPSDSTLPVGEIELGVFDISGGAVSYADARTGTQEQFSDINLQIAMTNLSSPLTVKGQLIWNKEQLKLDARLGSVQSLLGEKPTGFKTILSSPNINADFDGKITLREASHLEGAFKLSTPSIRKLASWLKSPLTPGKGLKGLAISSRIVSQGKTISLSNAKITLDGMHATGSTTIQLAQPRPRVKVNFTLDKLDLNQYISTAKTSAPARTSSKPTGWSTAKIDFSGLKTIDADMQLKTGKILYKKVITGASTLKITMAGGLMTANLAKLALYKGQATGSLSLDGRTAKQIIRIRGNLKNVDAFPLLRDAARFEWIEGKANMDFDIVSRGTSQKQMMTNLSGRGVSKFADGAVRGINVAQMFRNVTSNVLSGWSKSKTAKTDFSSLDASFAIVRGIATNKDLKMIGPLVRITGAGMVSMPAQKLDYKINPKVVASLQGQGGNADLKGLNVPIIIKGAWAKPSIYPDIAGILSNPAAALKKLNIGAVTKKGGIGNLINSFTKPKNEPSKSAQPGAPQKPEQDSKDPLEKLKKLF